MWLEPVWMWGQRFLLSYKGRPCKLSSLIIMITKQRTSGAFSTWKGRHSEHSRGSDEDLLHRSQALCYARHMRYFI